jgi:hypothetical protein
MPRVRSQLQSNAKEAMPQKMNHIARCHCGQLLPVNSSWCPQCSHPGPFNLVLEEDKSPALKTLESMFKHMGIKMVDVTPKKGKK